MSIEEAQRSFTYFHLYGYPTDLIVANRVLPAGVGGPTSTPGARRSSATCRWSRSSSRRSRSARCPSSTRRWSASSGCASSATALFGDDDPTSSSTAAGPYSVQREDGGYVLSLELPFTSRDEVTLSRQATSWCCRSAAGAVRSSCHAPSSTRRPSGAKMDGNTLQDPVRVTIAPRFGPGRYRERRRQVGLAAATSTEAEG